MWAIGWWFTRRYLRRRAARAVSGVTTRASARSGRIRTVLGALALVGALGAGLVVWRRFMTGGGGGDGGGWSPPPPDEPPLPTEPSPSTPEAVAA